jgi:CheY-like chemotaxis protein
VPGGSLAGWPSSSLTEVCRPEHRRDFRIAVRIGQIEETPSPRMRQRHCIETIDSQRAAGPRSAARKVNAMNAALCLGLSGVPVPAPENACLATRVLVIEDDPDQRELAAELLRLEGFEVATAQDGVDALLFLRSNAVLPDVVLLDLEMPVMDGREFRARQLRDSRAGFVPVVVLSSSSPQGVDAAAYLNKPCSPEELVAVLRRVAG